jgi:hypothetical protein
MSRVLLGLLLAGVLAGAYTWPASAQGLSVRVVSITNPVTRDAEASLTVRTDPGAECHAVARLVRGRKTRPSDKGAATPGVDLSSAKSGSKSLALAPRIADTRGLVTWKTRVDAQAPRGPVLVTVQCAHGGRTGQAEATTEIR